jgi:ATP-dependent RNA helicase DeaD
MIIFVRTKTATVEVADKLEAHGFAAEALNGDMNQAMRERTVSRLKSGQLDIVVATDVAARGLDVQRISHVVNFDIPNDPESYVHRIGRTGRAGRTGKALLFVQPRERGLLKAIERTTRQPIPAIDLPSADDLSEHRIDRFVSMLRETISEQDLDFYYRLVSRIEKEQETSALDIAAALTFLSQKSRPFIVNELEAPSRKEQSNKRGRDRAIPERTDRKHKSAHRQDDPVSRECYRLEVGKMHDASPREIVGAIANEAGLDGQMIGRIEIREDHSLVDLPAGMPKDIFQHLRGVYVCGQKLNLSLVGGAASQGNRKPRKKGKQKKPKR